jgi:glutathione S-transferase
MATPKLISLGVSPWTERAKWSLDHHGLPYRVVDHFPVLGERRLRRIVGPDKPKATVPVLVDGDRVLSESWDIALYADGKGSGARLIPPEHEPAIRKWTALADETMQSGRALVIASLLADPAALDEAGPPAVPRWARPLLRPVARGLTRAFAKKYELRLGDEAPQTRVMRAALDELRAGLASGAGFLLGTFTYADIAMATLLQGVAPVDDRFIRLGPATRRVWTRAALAAEYADLVAWRDALYDKKRRRG